MGGWHHTAMAPTTKPTRRSHDLRAILRDPSRRMICEEFAENLQHYL